MKSKRLTVGLLLVLSVQLAYALTVPAAYTQQSPEQLELIAYTWPSPLQRCVQLTGAIRNLGTVIMNLGAAKVSVNGASAPLTVSTTELMPEQATTFSIQTTTADYLQGSTYALMITTPSGGVFFFTIKCGGTGDIDVAVVNATDGSPLQGVVVSLFTVNFSGWLVESQTTDSSGHTTFSGLGDGNYDINATLSQYGQAAGTGATIAGGNSVSVKLSVYQTYGLSTIPISVTVWVQDRRDGTYISQALVEIRKTATGWVQSEYTGVVVSNVVFTVPGSGQYEITVSHEGYGFNTVTETVTHDATYVIQLPWAPETSTTSPVTTQATQEVISIPVNQFYGGLALVFAVLFLVTLVVLLKQRRSGRTIR